MTAKAIVIGAGGYSGAELVSLLSCHPNAELLGIFGSNERDRAQTRRFDEEFPQWRGTCSLPIEPLSIDAALALDPDVVFLATPAEVSLELVPAFLSEDIAVIDLSGAYRLADASLYQQHYGFEHKYRHLFSHVTYGLPELWAAKLKQADLIALPGCYPTSILLPLLPMRTAGAIDLTRCVICDSVSGVSGAGRSPSLRTSYCEVSFGPYGVLSHRHTPEIEQYAELDVIFTPHLAPFDRGIVSTIHVALAPGWDDAMVRNALATAVGGEPFIRLLPPGQWPSVNDVRHTNFCDIGIGIDANRSHLIIVSAIDNLLKGAAGQAVQCLNIRFGLGEMAGLGVHVACHQN